MKTLAKHHDLISAGLALAFVIFVLGGVIANALSPATASHTPSGAAAEMPSLE